MTLSPAMPSWRWEDCGRSAQRTLSSHSWITREHGFEEKRERPCRESMEPQFREIVFGLEYLILLTSVLHCSFRKFSHLFSLLLIDHVFRFHFSARFSGRFKNPGKNTLLRHFRVHAFSGCFDSGIHPRSA